MIYRLYGEETSTHFRMEWFLMAYMSGQNWTDLSTGKIFYPSTSSNDLKNTKV
jgi:hypothetical protein